VVEILLMLQSVSRIADVPAQAPNPPAAPGASVAPEAPAVISGQETPKPARIIVNGKDITMEGGGGAVDATTSTGFPFPTDIPTNVYKLGQSGIIGVTLMIVAFPVFGFLKALVNRSATRQLAAPSRDTTDRLQRIEAAVEAMSVEVERISEGQRFVTRVLAERSSAPS